MKTLHQFTKRSAQYLFIPILVGLIMLLQSCNSTSDQTGKATPVHTNSLLTSIPLKTPSLTAISATITPLPENKNQTLTPTPTNLDTIYVWGPPFYGYLHYWDFYNNMVSVMTSDQQKSLYIVSPFFSPFSNEVALLVKNKDELLELRVANIDLSNARLLWTDTGNSFGYSSRSADQIFDILWGPGGKFVLISINDVGRTEPFQKNVVIDVQSQAFWETNDKCNHYSISQEKSNTVSLFCELISGEYLVLEADGAYEKAPSLLGAQNVFMKKWSISPNSESILYATEQDDIFVHSQGYFKLPTRLGPTVDDLEPLQWSRSGNRLLIWGDNTGCLHGEQAPCWKVIDAQTGELLWAEDTITYARATLSPDGKRLVRFMSGTFLDRYGAITDISTNSSESITDTSFSKVVWIR